MSIGQILYHPIYGKLTVSKKAYSAVKNAVVWYAIDSQGVERELDGTETTQAPKEEVKTDDEFELKRLLKLSKTLNLVQGPQGEPGKAGKTPIPGIDYYSKAQVEQMIRAWVEKLMPSISSEKEAVIKAVVSLIPVPDNGKDGKDGKTPVKGIDYFTKADTEILVERVVKKVLVLVKDGKDGFTPAHRWEGSKLQFQNQDGTWGEAVDLRGFTGRDAANGGGIHKIDDATDVNIKNPITNQTLVYSAETKKWVNTSVAAVSGSGHTIQEEGTPLTARSNLNFIGDGVTAADDPGNDATTVTITASNYTDEMAQDAVGNNVGTGLDYDDTTGAISVDKTELSLVKGDVGLGNVDNTSDASKPVSTAQQTALDLKVDKNVAIAGATKTKITYDAKGLVTSGADATTADIADSTNKRYVTDAQLTVLGNTSGTNTGDQTNISGNAATVTTNANLTGPVTSVGNATTITDKAVTLVKMNDVATASVFYRKTAGTGVPEVQTLATLKTDLGLTGTNSGDQDLSGLVPYTGATTNVDLGAHDLALEGSEAFTAISTPANPASGKVNIHAESAPSGVARMVMQTSTGAVLAFFRDGVLTVRNTTGSTITKGQVVYINGSNGTTPTVALAKADASTTALCVGLALANIANNAYGTVMNEGEFSGLDTSGFSAGDELYLSAATAGAVTNVAPSLKIHLGTVITSSASGKIQIFLQHFVPPVKATGAEIVTGTDDAKFATPKALADAYVALGIAPPNLLKNGNFINNSTNGYGGTPDDWTNSNANPVQGGIPALTKQNLIDILGVADGDIEALYPLNGFVNTDDFADLSSNNYPLDSATHVPGTSLDGLMGTALDFESGSSQYGSGSAANACITGSQTWFAFIKPETAASGGCFMGNSATTTYKVFQLPGSGCVEFSLAGLTTNTTIDSDVILTTGKWNFVCGVYDSVNSKLKVWVNGIKKEVTASGSASVTNSTFNIGRTGGTSNNYFDGLIQNACVLSVALTDNQVKKLFAETLYKGQKIRRATTNAIQYQDLPMDLVERLRGKTVALRADMYQDTASTGQISLLVTLADGTTSETIISATDATTGSWLTKYATGTIGATATNIRIQLKHSTSDGNTWFRRVSLYEGSTSLPYDHSKDDWSRFPRLLKMDIPAVISGYQFEENRKFSCTPTPTGFSSNPATIEGRFSINGKLCDFDYSNSNQTSNATTFTIPLPVLASASIVSSVLSAVFATDNSVNLTSPARFLISTAVANNIITVGKDMAGAAWTASGNKRAIGSIRYEID